MWNFHKFNLYEKSSVYRSKMRWKIFWTLTCPSSSWAKNFTLISSPPPIEGRLHSNSQISYMTHHSQKIISKNLFRIFSVMFFWTGTKVDSAQLDRKFSPLFSVTPRLTLISESFRHSSSLTSLLSWAQDENIFHFANNQQQKTNWQWWHWKGSLTAVCCWLQEVRSMWGRWEKWKLCDISLGSHGGGNENNSKQFLVEISNKHTRISKQELWWVFNRAKKRESMTMTKYFHIPFFAAGRRLDPFMYSNFNFIQKIYSTTIEHCPADVNQTVFRKIKKVRRVNVRFKGLEIE